jgi:hypothetical protein
MYKTSRLALCVSQNANVIILERSLRVISLKREMLAVWHVVELKVVSQVWSWDEGSTYLPPRAGKVVPSSSCCRSCCTNVIANKLWICECGGLRVTVRMWNPLFNTSRELAGSITAGKLECIHRELNPEQNFRVFRLCSCNLLAEKTVLILAPFYCNA